MVLISIVAVFGIHNHADWKINERCHLSEPRPDTNFDTDSDMDSDKNMTSGAGTSLDSGMTENLGQGQTSDTRVDPSPISNTTHDCYEPLNHR